jgi:ABC-type glycerol-3-phosphate transport system substrate-binding protein
MKRNRLRLLAAGVTALVLAGCSTTGGGTTSGASQDPGLQEWATSVKDKYNGTSITIAAQTHPSTAAMQAMTADFTAQTGIDVRWDIVDQNSLKQKIELDYQSGNAAYDAVMVDGFWMSSFAERGIVADVTKRLDSAPDFFDYKDILPAYSEGLQQVDGKSYGVQIAGETRFIGYRTDLFEKYDKKPPTTMKEYLELAQFFNGKEDGLYGHLHAGTKGYPLRLRPADPDVPVRRRLLGSKNGEGSNRFPGKCRGSSVLPGPAQVHAQGRGKLHPRGSPLRVHLRAFCHVV